MASHVVTQDNWNDPAFWQSLSTTDQDTLDLSALGSGFLFEINAFDDRLTLTDGDEIFVIGGATAAGVDARLGSGRIHHFDTVLGPDSEADDIAVFGNQVQDITLGGGDDFADLAGGDDTIDGGAGNDTLIAGGGNDSIATGQGADLVSAGGGADTITGVSLGDTIDGGSGGTDADILDLRGAASPGGSVSVLSSTPDADGNGLDGVVGFYDADGTLEGTLDFTNIETILPCFVAGTAIRTLRGDVAVEEIATGDAVLTRDNGFQPVRWTGTRALSAEDLASSPQFAPIQFAPGTLGPNQPAKPLRVSPQHRVLVQGARSDVLVGMQEVLVAALHLTTWQGVTRTADSSVTYVHLLFDQHEIVLSDGAWTESFQPAAATLADMAHPTRLEILALFPELKHWESPAVFPDARPTLKRHEARLLAQNCPQTATAPVRSATATGNRRTTAAIASEWPPS